MSPCLSLKRKIRTIIAGYFSILSLYLTPKWHTPVWSSEDSTLGFLLHSERTLLCKGSCLTSMQQYLKGFITYWVQDWVEWVVTVNTKLCRCAPKCPGPKWDFPFPCISYCIQRLCFHSVYAGSCYLLSRWRIKAGRKEDLSILPLRKLQDLDEKTRGQSANKGSSKY